MTIADPIAPAAGVGVRPVVGEDDAADGVATAVPDPDVMVGAGVPGPTVVVAPGIPVPAAVVAAGVPDPAAVVDDVAPLDELGTTAREAYTPDTGPPATGMVLTTFPLATSSTVSAFCALSVIKARLPSELKVTEPAPAPTLTVFVTFPVARSIRAISPLG